MMNARARQVIHPALATGLVLYAACAGSSPLTAASAAGSPSEEEGAPEQPVDKGTSRSTGSQEADAATAVARAGSTGTSLGSGGASAGSSGRDAAGSGGDAKPSTIMPPTAAAGSGSPSPATAQPNAGQGGASTTAQASAGQGGNLSADAGSGGAAAATSTQACSPPALSQALDGYFKALAAHDPSLLKVSQQVKFTENTHERKMGDGLWRSAGEAFFRRDAFDPERCNAVSEAVLADQSTGTIFNVRLKLAADGVSEIETNSATGAGGLAGAVGTGTQIGLASLESENATWYAELPQAQRSTREELESIADAYLRSLGETVEVPLGMPCRQQFNGAVLQTCETVQAPPLVSGGPTTHRRVVVTDPDTGIVSAYGVGAHGALTFVLLKVTSGKLRFIDATFGVTATTTGWD